MVIILQALHQIRRRKIKAPFCFQKKKFSTMSSDACKSPISVARESLMKYPGGSVKLNKDEQIGIATICFSSPQKKNAWTGNMMVQLLNAVSELEKWELGKGVLLYSEGDDFCSGADLSLVGDSVNSEVGRHMCAVMHEATTKLSRLPLISAVLAQGRVIGGGTELLTACDFRLVTSNFWCNFVHLKMGLITGWGGTTRLVKLLGPVKSLQLMSSCACLSANEAMAIGLATAILDNEGDHLTNALNWMKEHILDEAPVLHTMKRAVIAASNLSLQESLEKESELFLSVMGGPEFKAAVAKHLKHRH